jgi:hypothetical protein
MKANELRIGNLVRNNLNGEILKPCDVLCDGINTDNIEGLNYGFIEPIPLTEEWLLKFGFTQCENNSWYEKKIPNLNIMLSCNLNGRFCIEHKDNIVTIIDCCYNVHQLQNIYFALIGEELTFKQQKQ